MKKYILGILLGILLCSGVVYGANLFKAEDIIYNDTNVNAALNDIYNKVNGGNLTTNSILSNGQIIQNSYAINATSPFDAKAYTATMDSVVNISTGYQPVNVPDGAVSLTIQVFDENGNVKNTLSNSGTNENIVLAKGDYIRYFGFTNNHKGYCYISIGVSGIGIVNK